MDPKRISGLVRHAAEELAPVLQVLLCPKSSSALENLFPKTPASANVSAQHAM
jgi:hypothetical protein